MNTEEHRTPVVWRPQPRQAEFMRRPEPEALYGGAPAAEKAMHWSSRHCVRWIFHITER